MDAIIKNAIKIFKKIFTLLFIVYATTLGGWLSLIFITEFIGGGKVFGAVIILLFWIFLAPIKSIMQGLGIPPPSFLAFNPESNYSCGLDDWVIVHLFNIFILFIISTFCSLLISFLMKNKACAFGKHE